MNTRNSRYQLGRNYKPEPEALEARELLTSVGFTSNLIAEESVYVVAVADFNNDDLPELVRKSNEGFSYYPNLGNGEFGDPIALPTGELRSNIDIGDIDGDGDEDFVVSGRNVGVAWFENTDGNATFVQREWIRQRETTTVRLDDVDSDGDLDVIAAYKIARWNYGPSIWFENMDRLGLGNFGPQQMLDGIRNKYEHVQAVNLDDDTENELLLNASNDTTIVFGWMDGPTGVYQQIDPIQRYSDPVPTADTDGDGITEIIVPNRAEILRFEYDVETSEFQSHSIVDFRQQMGIDRISAGPVFVHDMDNDSDPDILTSANNEHFWLINESGNFDTRVSLTARPGHVAAIDDFDSDGDVDVLFNLSDWNTNPGVSELLLFKSDLAQRVAQTDANRDGEVSFDDYLVLAENFGREHKSGVVDGDFNGDEEVSFEDYLMLAKNYGLQLFVVPPSGGDRT